MRFVPGEWYVGSQGIWFCPEEAPKEEQEIRPHQEDCPRSKDASLPTPAGTSCPGCNGRIVYVGRVRLTNGQVVKSMWRDDARRLSLVDRLRGRLSRLWRTE